jgi:hypothetical protein
MQNVMYLLNSKIIITHLSPHNPPFPKIVWERGKEIGKQLSVGKTACGFLFTEKVPLNCPLVDEKVD